MSRLRWPDTLGGMTQARRRTVTEIQAAEKEFFDRIWYFRTLSSEHRTAQGLAVAEDALKRIEATYKDLVTEGDFEIGVMHGKLSALRWVLGDEWDMLDT